MAKKVSFLVRFNAFFFTCVFLCFNTQAAVFEDFSGPQFDLTKWTSGETAIKVEYGKLLLKRQSRPGDGRWQGKVIDFVDVPHNIKTKITVDGQLDNSPSSGGIVGGIDGLFYKTVDGGNNKDVVAEINVFCNSPLSDTNSCNVYYALYYVYEGDWAIIKGDDFSPTFAAGTEVIIGLEYDENTNNFTFRLDNETAVLTGPTKSSSTLGYVNLHGHVKGGDSTTNSTEFASGTIMVSFDDVVASGGDLSGPVSDTFSSPWINPDYWANVDTGYEQFWGSRLFKDGQLELILQNDAMSRTQTVAAIDVAHHTDYLQADITIDSETMISGDTADDRVRVQLQGFYYNNTFENPDDIKENDSTGELGVQLEIQKKRSDGTLQAIGYMYRCPDAVCSAVPNPFWEVLDCDVQYDTPVTVALERNDRRFTWTCNGASTTYDYPENLKLYDSIPWKIRRIRARAYTSGAPGAKTYLKAYVDNVYTVKKKRSLLLSLIPILAAQKK